MEVAQLSHGRGWLNYPAALSLGRVDRAIGHPLQITEAGRSRAEQQAHWDRYVRYLNGGPWAPLAARPGTSPHEFGNAIDTNERLVALLSGHGWSRPLKSEPWHFVYNPNNDKHRYEPAPAGQEEDDMALTPAQVDALALLPGMNVKLDEIASSVALLGGMNGKLDDIGPGVEAVQRAVAGLTLKATP